MFADLADQFVAPLSRLPSEVLHRRQVLISQVNLFGGVRIEIKHAFDVVFGRVLEFMRFFVILIDFKRTGKPSIFLQSFPVGYKQFHVFPPIKVSIQVAP